MTRLNQLSFDGLNLSFEDISHMVDVLVSTPLTISSLRLDLAEFSERVVAVLGRLSHCLVYLGLHIDPEAYQMVSFYLCIFRNEWIPGTARDLHTYTWSPEQDVPLQASRARNQRLLFQPDRSLRHLGHIRLLLPLIQDKLWILNSRSLQLASPCDWLPFFTQEPSFVVALYYGGLLWVGMPWCCWCMDHRQGILTYRLTIHDFFNWRDSNAGILWPRYGYEKILRLDDTRKRSIDVWVLESTPPVDGSSGFSHHFGKVYTVYPCWMTISTRIIDLSLDSTQANHCHFLWEVREDDGVHHYWCRSVSPFGPYTIASRGNKSGRLIIADWPTDLLKAHLLLWLVLVEAWVLHRLFAPRYRKIRERRRSGHIEPGSECQQTNQISLGKL